jgi:hypothetical protein
MAPPRSRRGGRGEFPEDGNRCVLKPGDSERVSGSPSSLRVGLARCKCSIYTGLA